MHESIAMIILPLSIIVLSLLSAKPFPASSGMEESSLEPFYQQIMDSFSESLKNVVASLTARQDKIEEVSKHRMEMLNDQLHGLLASVSNLRPPLPCGTNLPHQPLNLLSPPPQEPEPVEESNIRPNSIPKQIVDLSSSISNLKTQTENESLFHPPKGPPSILESNPAIIFCDVCDKSFEEMY